jgi:hypothetical protein
MNQQEIFDKVATHLITQGVQALTTADVGISPTIVCAYRGDNGTMCAAGCLIPDKEYKSWFEATPWGDVRYKIPSLASLTNEDHELIESLQLVHDWIDNWKSIDCHLDVLKEKLRYVASEYGLSSDILN